MRGAVVVGDLAFAAVFASYLLGPLGIEIPLVVTGLLLWAWSPVVEFFGRRAD